MIDDMLQQNWSTLHSRSIDLTFGSRPKRLGRSQSKDQGTETLRIERPDIGTQWSLHALRRVFHFSSCAFEFFQTHSSQLNGLQ